MQYVYLVTSLLLIAAGGWGAVDEWPRLGTAIFLLGLGLGGQGLRSWRQDRTPRLELPDVEAEEAELLSESYRKAVADYRYLEEAQKSLGDRELMRQLGRMQHVSRNMLSYLQKHPKKLPMAQQFIDYYQDRAVALVQKYQELDATELTTERVAELKNRMKATLSGLDAAYVEQFERILSDQLLTTDAELTVMEQHLDAQGIRPDKQGQPIEMLGRAEEKRQDMVSMDGLFDSLQAEGTLPVPRGKYSLVPSEERPDVIKHKVIQSMLAILLGAVGAHKFYQGKSFQGVLYFLFCWTSLPTWISMVEGVRYLFMPVDDFYLQYYREDK